MCQSEVWEKDTGVKKQSDDHLHIGLEENKTSIKTKTTS